MEVKRLDNNVTANLRSGYSVNNIPRCVNELVLNSLDANSTHITVRVNLTTFRIQVVDDGEGITKTNLEHVGKRYYTNKCNSTHDLEKVRKQFGFKGEALSSIANNAKIIKITSRAWDTTDSQTLMQTFDKTIEGNQHTIIETAQRASGGTTVTVQEFLYNLPVRQKRTKNLEFNEIKENLQKLFLLHPNITFSLRDDSTKKILFSSTPVETVESALQQQIDNLDEKLIKYYSITRGRMIVKILLYLKQYENSKWQMFFVNKLHVKSAQLTSHVNDILSKSALCNKKTRNNWSSAGGGNYMYLFNITCPNSKYHIINYNDVEFKNLETIYKVIERQLRKIFKTENIWIAEPEKKKKIECNLERRIHLSGFPGAFKATAVRKPGEEIEEEEDEENFVYNPDFKVNCQTEQRVETKSASSVEEPLRLTYSSSSYPDLLRPPYQEDKEVFPSTNYSCSQDNNQKIITMNVKEPLETTSTIGRNYVLNKFLQDNNYNPKICPPNDKFDDQHRKEREYLKELQMREAWILKKEKELQIALEKAQAIEIERKRDIPYLNPNENMKKYHYESNRNDVALAHYYRYKHERKRRQENDLMT
ncbi:DNA mismatch repair protein Mlh3-like [Atheta coriaria]|uniref:DNA mismatch repair protein Mlh3-like n=1 Tax=Dalotia coriaria TaxID=877792 RepID=UPI0031F40252